MILAIDAGGTGTRAAVLDTSGRCLGLGRSDGGNPTSAGIGPAVAAIRAAAVEALGGLPAPSAPASASIALAGEQTTLFYDAVAESLGALGFGAVALEPDLLGMFHSGTPEGDGHVLIAGTGAVAARVVDGKLDRVAGGNGWLLGDAGSGYWIGHAVARAVVADLDGQGRATSMTGYLCSVLDIPDDARLEQGRRSDLGQLVSRLYAMPPAQLSRFAPIAFQAREDVVAREIVSAASALLADLLASVRSTDIDGPVVAGGSVLIAGMLAAQPDLAELVRPLTHNLEIIPVPDGLVGAAVLALRGAGIGVDDAMFRRVRAGIERVRKSQRPMNGLITPARNSAGA